MNREHFEELKKFKQAFLQDESLDPYTCPYLKKEFAASWEYSRRAGINPFLEIDPKSYVLPTDFYDTAVKNNRLLIDVASPSMKTFAELASSSGYELLLTDVDGTILVKTGVPIFVPHEIRLNINVRSVFCGTKAGHLCAYLKRPIQLLGVEHYSVAFEDIIASAAPIIGDKGEVIAVLTFFQKLPVEEQLAESQNQYTLGLVTALASSIQAQLRLKESYERLELMNEKLEKSLSLIDGGIISINENGQILSSNSEGIRILCLDSENISSSYISEFLEHDSHVLERIREGRNCELEENLCIKGKVQEYVITIRPVINQATKKLDSALLRIITVEKINQLITQRSGTTATYYFEDIIGSSEPMCKAITLGERFARSLENVLLIGESGTGKEMFAQAMHNIYRPLGPFISINCAAMPRELIESELFGYEGGSFTGAERSGRPGKIELAHKGTLFLDEIGDMPYELQAVLLRVLQDKQVVRVGGRRYKKVDFKLIAATNQNLEKAVAEKHFREDLFFRLSVLTLNLPPLRVRKEDIEELSSFFVSHYSYKIGIDTPTITTDTLKIIKEYDWPGNVRQLENAIIYAVNTAQKGIIRPEHLPQKVLSINDLKAAGSIEEIEDMYSMKEWEVKAIKEAMQKTGNNILLASELLGINKSTLYRKLRELGGLKKTLNETI